MAIIQAALDAVAPELLVQRALAECLGEGRPRSFLARRTTLDERPAASYRLVAAGKAASRMATAAARLLGPSLQSALVIVPENDNIAPPDGADLVRSTHPVPGFHSEEAGRRAIRVAESLPPDGRLLVLLSGGASALMASAAEGLTLADKARTTEVLLRSGADIHAINTVRKHLSAVKGGWLAARSAAPTLTLAISDVVGDDLSVIGSGPTVADPSTFADARRVIERHGGAAAFPPAVVSHLERGAAGAVSETPKPGDPRLRDGHAEVIGGRHDAMRAGAQEAERRGYAVDVTDAPVVGEAREAARTRVARIPSERGRPLCLVSSGETTVRVVGGGRGGRNQEFALAAAPLVAALDRPVVLASVGTDGIDGPTDAAGAIADSTTVRRAADAGLSPDRTLAENDAHAFFAAIGDLIHTGPTGTNVGDLQVILLA